MDAPSLPKERRVVKGQERTFDMLHALRKKLWENGVRDQAEQDDFIDKYIVAPESRIESRNPGGLGAAPVTYKYTVSSGGNKVLFQSISRLQNKLPNLLKEWRSRQQSGRNSASHAADECVSESRHSHITLLEDAAAPEINADGGATGTEPTDMAAAQAEDTAPPVTGVTPAAGHILAVGESAGPAGHASGLRTGAKRPRVERAPAESVINILAQAGPSLLQNSNFMNVMAKLVENERVDKEIELRRISLKEKQLDVCKMVMSDNAEDFMTAMAGDKQQALPPPAAAAAADADAAHGTQN